MRDPAMSGVTAAVILGVIVPATHAQAPSFHVFYEMLPEPGEGDDFLSQTNDVSADGSIVVGSARFPTGEVLCRWINTGAPEFFAGELPQYYFREDSVMLSGNGAVVVGVKYTSNQYGSTAQAYRWTESALWHPLIDISSGRSLRTARGVNHDGTVIVGSGLPIAEAADGSEERAGAETTAGVKTKPRVAELEAQMWREGAGIISVGDLPGGRVWSEARAVSGDGTVVVGTGTSANGTEAFRWTESEGIVGLGDLSGGAFESLAWDVSDDGSVVVGTSVYLTVKWSRFKQAFRWTADGGMQGLGFLPGADASTATLTNADGSIIVGYSGDQPFLWTEELGMRSVDDLFVNTLGLDLGMVKLTWVSGISDDGTTLTGVGFHEYGEMVGWVAEIPAPPCFNDLNGDRKSTLADFNMMALNFGTTSGAARADGDLTGDGAVDSADFNVLVGDFGCGAE